MPTTDVKVAIVEPIKDEKADGVCAVCPHPWAAHDSIGVRYCSATIADERPRGCICVKS